MPARAIRGATTPILEFLTSETAPTRIDPCQPNGPTQWANPMGLPTGPIPSTPLARTNRVAVMESLRPPAGVTRFR